MPNSKPRPARIKTLRRHNYRKEEFRNCDALKCPNIVSVIDLPRSYSGPVYCILHRDRKKPDE